jgi:hypothetical protein
MKKIIPFILALCAMLVLFAGCDSNQEPAREPISTADAVQAVLRDLDMEIDEVNPHVHPGNFQDSEVYYVYVTVDGENMAYAVDKYSGEILNIAKSDHSH